MARVTLRDVGKHAGVSTATVSFVLNDNPLVAAETRARVQKSLRELGYVYDRSAAALRTQRTGVVGLIITTLRNPFFADFATGIQHALGEAGRVVVLGVSDEDVPTQSRLLQVMGEHRIDGVVLIPARGTTPTDLAGLGDIPLLLLARRVPDLTADYIGADNVTGARAATKHLIDHGCHAIAFIGGFEDSSSRTERLTGLRSALQAAGRRRAPAAPAGRPDRVTSTRLARDLLLRGRDGHPGTPIDGILCFNDTVAFGVLDAAADLGLTVGRDVRIIGFDDVPEAAENRPALSSVGVSRMAGSDAAALMLRRVTGKTTPAESIMLDTTLRPRQTCGCHPAPEDASGASSSTPVDPGDLAPVSRRRTARAK